MITLKELLTRNLEDATTISEGSPAWQRKEGKDEEGLHQ